MELPAAFLEYISQYPQLQILAESLTAEPQTSLRFNPEKAASATSGKEVPWCQLGRYLDRRIPFTFDPALHQGRYYVQDASSMAIYSVVQELVTKFGLSHPLRLLDACAAPGGKTTAAISALPADALVVANEYDYKRANILAENVAKWGSSNVIVSRGDTSRLSAMGLYFDIAVVDAPCSGEGMMRKDEQAVKQWCMSLTEQCSRLQREILGNVWQSLAPGGYLVYSTCAFNRLENEENAEWLVDELGAEPIVLESLQRHVGAAGNSIESGINTPQPCYRFIPGRVKGEGLFVSVVRKPLLPGKSSKMLNAKQKSTAAAEPSQQERQRVSSWIKSEEYALLKMNEAIWSIPKLWAEDARKIANILDIVALGTKVASIVGKDVQPEHELALSQSLNTGAFPTFEVDYEQAIHYLQRQALNIEAPRGIVMLTYKHIPLGFVKNVGNRANNMYPKAWRILSNAPTRIETDSPLLD